MSWTPTPERVAAYLPTRFGGGLPSASTRPTLDQVAQICEQQAEALLAEVGDIPAVLEPLAARVATIGAASYIELVLAPEQANGIDSVAGVLWDRYRLELEQLRKAVNDHLPGRAAHVGTIRIAGATRLGAGVDCAPPLP